MAATVTDIKQGKIPRVKLHIPIKNLDIEIVNADIDDWLTFDEPNAEATVIDEAALNLYPFVKTLRLPTNWNDLTFEQANDLMDPFA